jgi:uncharacterized protein
LAGIISHQIEEKFFDPIFYIFFLGWETVGLMLLGMAGLRSGFLTGQWSKARYMRVMLIGFGIGIPAYAAFGSLIWLNDFQVPALVAFGMAAPTLFRPPMIAATAAAVILLSRRNGWLSARVGAAGRAAFTNYLGTSILMCLLFYGYGAGLFGRLSRAELWLVVLPMWALMLLWSKPWLDRFRYGPFEWLWRSLARGDLQPMRKPASV